MKISFICLADITFQRPVTIEFGICETGMNLADFDIHHSVLKTVEILEQNL